MFKKLARINYFSFIITLVMMMTFNAQQSVANTCDTEIYKSMQEKAWMEMEREREVNNSYIWRPDSVLQYTCFNSLAETILANGDGGGANDLFISNDGTRSSTVFPATGSFNTHVAGVMNDYIADQVLDATYQNTSGTNPNANDSAGPYGCGRMQDVWATSKCLPTQKQDFYSLLNFKDGQDDDGNTIDDFTSISTAHAEIRCAVPDNASATSAWDVAHDKTHTLNFAGVPADYFDEITGQFELWLALNEANPANSNNPLTTCSKPIPTGVIVVTTNRRYYDGICPNPGCSLRVTGTNTVECCNSAAIGASNASCSNPDMRAPTTANPPVTPYP